MLYIKQKPAKNAGFKHLLQFDFGNSSRHLTMFEVGVFLLGLLDKILILVFVYKVNYSPLIEVGAS